MCGGLDGFRALEADNPTALTVGNTTTFYRAGCGQFSQLSVISRKKPYPDMLRERIEIHLQPLILRG
jgi:hypothetical protein